ncbi:MAG: TIR domain-containing protein [Chloroflexota bacterium]
MTQTNSQGKAFISYSRKDKAFVQKLEASLEERGIVTWVDWEGIPLSADWMAEITAAIQGADAFLFVISPDSLASKVCGEELALGLQYNKKLVPILHRIPEKDQPMHEKIAATNWVYLREEDDYAGTLPRLVETINTDLNWVHQHTRLLQRAVEWDRKRRNSSFLLHGTDLDEAERWMAEASGTDNRLVTPLQLEYIRASRQQATKRQRTLLAGVSVALVISIFLAVAAAVQRGAAVRNAELAANNAGTAVANQELANRNAELAQNNAFTAVANQELANKNAELAQNNASTAVANEQARATQQAIAVANEQLAKENERRAVAQRGAAQAQLVQQQPARLFSSTLLALFSLDISPSQVGEEVLRQNLSLMSVPLASMQQAASVSSMGFSPDGKAIISTGDGNAAYIWRADTGEKLAELAHDGKVNIGLYSPDGQWIVTGSDDGTARLWNAGDYANIAQYEAPLNTPDDLKQVADIAITADSRYLAVGRKSGTVTVIDLTNGRIIKQLPNPGKVNDVAFSRNGQRLAVATSKTAVVWNPYVGISYLSAKHDGEVYQVAFSPDGVYVVTASQDQTTHVLLPDSGRSVARLQHDDWVEWVAYSPDGYSFATAADDYTVRVWDAEDYRELLRLQHSGFVQYVTYDSNGWWLASSSHDGTARVWDPVSGQEMIRIPLAGKGGPLCFSPDGLRLLTSNEHGELRLWDVSQLEAALAVIINDQLVRSIAFSEDGRWLVSGTDDGFVRLWSVNKILDDDSNEELKRTVYQLGSGFIRNLLFNPNPPVLSVIGDNTLASVNLENLSEVKAHLYPDTYFVRGGYQPSGNLIAIANGDHETVSLYEPVTGDLLKTLEQPGGAYALSFDPRNENALAVGGKNQVWWWDVTTAMTITTIRHPGKILDVAFSHDGQWLAVSSNEGTIGLWKVNRDGAQIQLEWVYEMKSSNAVNDLEFDPQGAHLASASEGGLVQIWHLATGEEISRLSHPLAVRRVSYSHDGRLLASISGKLIFIWDAQLLPAFPSENLVAAACQRLTHNLTTEEWMTLELPGEREPICPNFP